jgi:hypothetical protein
MRQTNEDDDSPWLSINFSKDMYESQHNFETLFIQKTTSGDTGANEARTSTARKNTPWHHSSNVYEL